MLLGPAVRLDFQCKRVIDRVSPGEVTTESAMEKLFPGLDVARLLVATSSVSDNLAGWFVVDAENSTQFFSPLSGLFGRRNAAARFAS